MESMAQLSTGTGRLLLQVPRNMLNTKFREATCFMNMLYVTLHTPFITYKLIFEWFWVVSV